MKCKKLLSVALAVCMTFGSAAMLPENAFTEQTEITASAETITSGDWEYTENEDGTISLEKYNGTKTHLTIDDKIDGKKVTSISWYCFSDSGLISVVIPDGVSSIGGHAFYNCQFLSDVFIPDSVEYIGENAFNGCYWLEKITIPNNVEYIGKFAFACCDHLKEVNIPQKVTEIQNGTFMDCESLTAIEIPDSVTKIGYSSFSGCKNLENIDIPKSVTDVDALAFSETKWLTNQQNINPMVVVNGILIDGTKCKGDITLPDNISIADYAFNQCKDVTSITVPFSIKDIGHSAIGFYNYERLNSCKIYLYAHSPAVDWANGWGKYTDWDKVDFEYLDPENAEWVGDFKRIYDEETETLYEKGNGFIITGYTGNDTNLKIPSVLGKEKVVEIGSKVFENHDVKSIVIPDSVISIWGLAFFSCENLSRISLGTGVQTIGYGAFSGCKSLSDITLPNSVSYIDNLVFEHCESLTSISIPANVENIGNAVFVGCYKLKSIDVDSNNKNYCSVDGVLYDKNKTTLISCPGAKANIDIPNSVKKISYQAFVGCKNMKSITLGRNIKEIEDYAIGYEYYGGFQRQSDFLIKCYSGTAAEKYAKDNGFKFEILHDYSLDSTKNEVFVTKDSLKDLTLTYHRTEEDNKTFSLFRGVQVDGKTVDKTNYTAESGSLKLTLKKDYLSKLSVGTHKLTVLFEDAYVETDLIVKKTSAATKLRLSGHNRYDTSISIANQFKKLNGNSKFKNVIIASGTGFADALSSAYLAKVKDAPILIVAPGVEDKIVNYVKANTLSNATIYIIGGDAAVPKTVDAKLKQSFKNVKRLWGKNRFGTNLAVLKEAGTGEDHIIIGNGLGYADALSASATGKPILLTSGKGLTTAQKAYLKKAGYKAATLIGESDVVSKGVESDVRKLVKNTDRQGGRTRFETSVLIAKKFFKNPKTVSLAYGLNYPDGLCGAPLSMKYGCPLILASDAVTGPVREYAKINGVTSAVIYGGSDILSDKAVKTILGK